ncbi:MAG: histidine kinase, partial [Ginsengibacter sp.]
IAITLTQMGDVYRKAPDVILTEAGIYPGEKFTLALNYQKRALKLSQEIQAVDRQSEVWQALGETYEAKNDFAKALDAYKNYTILHDSIIGDERKQDIMRMGMQYNFEKKEDSLKGVSDRKMALDSAEIARQKTVKRSIAWGGVILLLAALTSFIFYKRKKDAQQQQKEAELKAEVSDTEMKALRAQMNPHFIFNSLNSISDYIAKNEHDKADEYLTRFASLMRMTLENSEKKMIPLSDDLKVLELYLQLESSRLNGKFDYIINVAESIDKENTLVPPMILQPFVENSIWHGIANKEGKGNILIRIKRQGDMLHCLIDDDGVGRKSSSPLNNVSKNQSLGMKITKTRIDMMNKVKKSNGTVELSELAIGMRVQINLPFELSF